MGALNSSGMAPAQVPLLDPCPLMLPETLTAAHVYDDGRSGLGVVVFVQQLFLGFFACVLTSNQSFDCNKHDERLRCNAMV